MTIEDSNAQALCDIEELLTLIQEVDKDGTLSKLEDMKSKVLQHETLFAHIITPSVISTLHNAIVDNFKINRRFLQLKRRIDNKRKLAELFIQAMINGVRSYNA